MIKSTFSIFAYITITTCYLSSLLAYGPSLNNPYQTPSFIYQKFNNQYYNQNPAFSSAIYTPPVKERSLILYRTDSRNHATYQSCFYGAPISSYYADYQPEPYEANFPVPLKRMGSEHAFKSGGAAGSGAAGVGAASAGVGSGGVGGGVAN